MVKGKKIPVGFLKKEREKLIKEICSNFEYIEWLYSFSLIHNSFSNDEWDYNTEIISDIDRKNAKLISLLYSGINAYAYNNHINPTSTEYGGFYRIIYRDCAFEIGFQSYQGSFFYCKKVEIGNDTDYINFEDIILNNRCKNEACINNMLELFPEFVKNAHRCGVPLEALSEVFNKTLDEIRKEKKKTLKKY